MSAQRFIMLGRTDLMSQFPAHEIWRNQLQSYRIVNVGAQKQRQMDGLCNRWTVVFILGRWNSCSLFFLSFSASQAGCFYIVQARCFKKWPVICNCLHFFCSQVQASWREMIFQQTGAQHFLGLRPLSGASGRYPKTEALQVASGFWKHLGSCFGFLPCLRFALKSVGACSNQDCVTVLGSGLKSCRTGERKYRKFLHRVVKWI